MAHKAFLPTYAAPRRAGQNLLPPPGTIFIGAFVDTTGHSSDAQQIAETASFETSLGRKLAIHLHYHLWSDPMIGTAENDDALNGRIPLISWSCNDGVTGVKDADIAAGLYDSAIAKRAVAVANYARPIFIRFKWEMNLLYHNTCADPAHDVRDNYGKRHYSPIEYIAAWEHIRTIFQANGATNVIWVWNPSGNGMKPGAYYPGDSQVDWIAFDWYDSFNNFFQTTYTLTYNNKTRRDVWTYPYLAAHFPNKPLMIGETGAVQDWQLSYFNGDPSDLNADQSLQTSFPRIKAYVYWDSKGTRGDYEILATNGLPAFSAFVNGPYESGMGPP